MPNPARTLHSFILASTIIVSVGALVTTRTLGEFVPGVSPLDLVALLLGLAAVAFAWMLRGHLIELPPRQSRDEWWRASLGKAVLLWSLLELPALLGAVALFLTHRLLVFVLLALLSVVGLVLASTGRLGAERDPRS